MVQVDDADWTGPTRQHELGHTDHARSGMDDLSALKDLDHDMGIDGVSEASNTFYQV